MTTTDQHLNTGAMALDALPPDEAAAFSLHLETCPTCSAELTSFLETAAILGSSVAQTPPRQPASVRHAGHRRPPAAAAADRPRGRERPDARPPPHGEPGRGRGV